MGAVNIAYRAGDSEIKAVFTGLRYREKERRDAVRKILDSRHDAWWSEHMKGYCI